MKFKNDYLKKGNRETFHTTLRQDILEDFQIMCIKAKQPIMGKCMDVALEMILKDENLKREFLNQLKLY